MNILKTIGNYWKVLVAAVLLLLAVVFYFNGYKTEKEAYETESKLLKSYINTLEKTIAENMKYADVQDLLEEANAEIDASRLDLYQHFPVEMKEEDQIMYVLYLEKTFGTEISFAFSSPQAVTALRDGSTLMGLTMTVNYETTYRGFQNMINYLATDSKITSVQYASISYDAASDTATGTVTLLLYLMDSDLLDYVSPDVKEPDVGKENLFD